MPRTAAMDDGAGVDIHVIDAKNPHEGGGYVGGDLHVNRALDRIDDDGWYGNSGAKVPIGKISGEKGPDIIVSVRVFNGAATG